MISDHVMMLVLLKLKSWHANGDDDDVLLADNMRGMDVDHINTAADNKGLEIIFFFSMVIVFLNFGVDVCVTFPPQYKTANVCPVYLGFEVLAMFSHQLTFDPFIDRVSARSDIIHLRWCWCWGYYKNQQIPNKNS